MKLNTTEHYFDLMNFRSQSVQKPLKTKSCSSRASLILFRFLGALTALKNSYSLDLFVSFCIKTKRKGSVLYSMQSSRLATRLSWFVTKILCACQTILPCLILLSLCISCSQFQPEFETSECAFNDEHRSVLVQVNLADSTFYSYENHLWRPINDHEGQDTHCTLVGKQMTLKSCWLLYCTNQVRLCNNRICETTEASTLPYCEEYSQITFQIKDNWQHFTVIIPIS